VWNSVKGAVAPAESVRAALLFVSRHEAPLGIVYATDAAADPRVKVAGTFPEDSHPPIVSKFQYRSAADAGRDGSGTAAERGRVASGVGDRSRSFEFGAAQAKPSAARCSRLSVRSCPGAVRPLAATNIQFWQGGLEISKTTRVFRSNQHRVVPVADYK
jgi:hypothetical protein